MTPVVSTPMDPIVSSQSETPARESAWSVPVWCRRVGLLSWYFVGFALAVSIVAVVVGATSEIFAPLVLGAFLAIVCWPIADWLADRGLSRGLAAAAVLVGLGALIFGVSWLTGLALVDQSDEMTANLDKAVEDIQGWLESTPIDDDLAERIQAGAAEAGPALTGGVADRAISFLDSAFGFIAGAILGAIVFYYLLKDGRTLLARSLEREEDPDARALYERVADKTVGNTQSYFRGRTAMAIVNGVAMGLAVWALGVPAAAAIAAVNIIGAYIPYLGAFVGGAFAVLMALGSQGVEIALVVLAISLVVNLVLENFLEPVLLGGSLHLHPLTILLATSLGGIIAGMIGLILAAPALAILFDIKRELEGAGFFSDT